MGVTELLASMLVGVLSAFLAVSAFAEQAIVASLERFGYELRTEITYEQSNIPPARSEPQKNTDDIEGLSILPSEFEQQEYGGVIPKILIDRAGRESQGAAILLAPTESSTSTATVTPNVTRAVSVNEAIVNVFCTLRSKSEIRATTGSGVFIDERGVILTNAHVAQFLLLEDEKRGITTSCSIRTGSPARAHFEAELLYLSPRWVAANAEELKSEAPSGTGERDYALLYVTESLEGELPLQFPALPYDTDALGNSAKNQAVLAAGFPAEIIKTDGPKADLRATVATTTITELFTYSRNKVDLVGIAPSVVGEGGSSGGPVVNLSGAVIGLIVTRGDEKKDGAKSLRAITLAYIERTIREETGYGLSEYLKDQLPQRARIFKETLSPLLGEIVKDALESR